MSIAPVVATSVVTLLGGGLIGVWFKYLIDRGRLTKDERQEAPSKGRCAAMIL